MDNLDGKFWRITIQGVVQSVGFRPYIHRLGEDLELSGYVKNHGNEGVEIVVRANKEILDSFVNKIQTNLPELAQIYTLQVSETEGSPGLKGFHIEKSSKKETGSAGISPLPPDIAICDECLEDVDTHLRRLDYPFTSCTNCGPRYSTIMDLPYDRPATSFQEFPLCKDCMTEYTTPQDRRFHAQTTCCRICGPEYTLYGLETEQYSSFDLSQTVDFIREGHILAILSLAGTHYCVDAFNQKKVNELRRLRRKESNKPFAVMMRSIQTVKKHCKITASDEQLLSSIRRPIVILPLLKPEKWQHVSPNLQTIGVMLPYSGLHHLLFKYRSSEVLVMTSANLPNQPMPISPKEVIKSCRRIADVALLHNRKIIQRIDDSVIRSHGNTYKIIRRSRGFAPSPIFIDYPVDATILGLGAEETNTAAILHKEKLIMTQHIGHITNLETLEFQKSAINHLLSLYTLSPDIVAVDQHPAFLNRINEQYYREKFDTSMKEIQHHVAHASSLCLDHSISPDEKVLIWSCDGYGYGSDGNAWGGELIQLKGSSWERISSLREVPYAGFDRNAKYPHRMLSIYLNQVGIDPIKYFQNNPLRLPHGMTEIRALVGSLHSFDGLQTTSLGRLLDACSALLGISDYRSYRGEPAITLEERAHLSANFLESDVFVKYENGQYLLDNLSLFQTCYNLWEQKESPADLAQWVLSSVGCSLASIALEQSQDISKIGFTGGVAYNQIITQELQKQITREDIDFLVHHQIPPGDGGISAGQNYFIAMDLSR